MQRSIHPAVVVIIVVAVLGIAIAAYTRMTAPPQWTKAQEEQARQLILGTKPGGIQFPQAAPPGK